MACLTQKGALLGGLMFFGMPFIRGYILQCCFVLLASLFRLFTFVFVCLFAVYRDIVQAMQDPQAGVKLREFKLKGNHPQNIKYFFTGAYNNNIHQSRKQQSFKIIISGYPKMVVRMSLQSRKLQSFKIITSGVIRMSLQVQETAVVQNHHLWVSQDGYKNAPKKLQYSKSSSLGVPRWS